jgi:chromosome segregation ATPase
MSSDQTTRPTLETILERINEMGAKLEAQITSLRSDLGARITSLEAQITSLRSEMDVQFAAVKAQLDLLNGKIDVLNDEFLEIKAKLRKHGKRLDALEKQPA